MGFYILDGRLSYVSYCGSLKSNIQSQGEIVLTQSIIGRYRIARGTILYATREQLQKTTPSTSIPLRRQPCADADDDENDAPNSSV